MTSIPEMPVSQDTGQIMQAFLTGDSVVDNYRPRTALGAKLLALRRAYIESGGVLLDDEAFEAELRSRRGGIDA